MALTYQSEKNVTLSRRNGTELIKLYPGTVGAQVALTAQNGVTQTDAQKELEAIHTKIDGLLTNADAMQYKGVINADGDLPATYEPGWTWKVGTEGTYKGRVCQSGDLIIANTSRAGSGNADGDFDIVQGNVDRPVSGPDTSTTDHIALFDGTDGMKLKDGGITLDELKQSVADAANKWAVHLDSLPESMPDELADGGLLFVDSAAVSGS